MKEFKELTDDQIEVVISDIKTGGYDYLLGNMNAEVLELKQTIPTTLTGELDDEFLSSVFKLSFYRSVYNFFKDNIDFEDANSYGWISELTKTVSPLSLLYDYYIKHENTHYSNDECIKNILNDFCGLNVEE